MAIDKALYQAPAGLDPADDVEIQIDIAPEDDLELIDEPEPIPFDANLVEYLDEGVLNNIATELIADYDADVQSRGDWLKTYVDGLKLLGLKYEERTEPWSGACGVTHPLLMESAVKFQSETIMETFPAAGPVRTKIIGKETAETKEAALRVESDMNTKLTEIMREYRPEHERMLISLPLAGNAFKKIYFDPSLDRPVAMFVPAEDIVVPYGAASLESCERVTHRMRKTRNELRKLQVSGFYVDVELGDPVEAIDEVEKQKAMGQGLSVTSDNRFQLLEMHVDYDLPGFEDVDENNSETGIALPYVITIEKSTNTVLAIRRNWVEGDPIKQRRQHFVHYGYIPGFGFYYFGLIHLIGGHAKAATSLIRQLVDAGTLANLPGGLKAKGMRIKGDDTPIAPGEFRDVDLPSGTIKDNVMALPYKEPSQTLAGLMDKIVEDARRFAATADLQVSDMSAQAPVGTTLAILERALKVMSAVQARVHFAMKQEFKLIAALIRDNTPAVYEYDPEVGDRTAKRGDYDMVEVIPVSDPNASTMSQRIVQYQAVLELSKTNPQIYDQQYLHRQMIETLGIKNASKLVPMPEDLKQLDPVSENMNILMGKPVKAFAAQDHDAHLAVHNMFLQDPKLAATIGQNPQAQGLIGALHAHIMEHVAHQYRANIEKMLGAPYVAFPEDDDENKLTPELETEVARLAAMSAAKLLQKDIAEAQMAQAQQQMQDPLVQMQQKELAIKESEVQRKQDKDITDAQLKKEKQDMDAKLKQMQLRIQAVEAAHRASTEKERMELDGARLASEMTNNERSMQNDLDKHNSSLQSQERSKSLDFVTKNGQKPQNDKAKKGK